MEELRPTLGAQPDVHLFEVSLPVVARNTGQIQSHEDLGVVNRQLIVGIELMHHAKVVAVPGLGRPLDVLPRHHVRRGHHVVALRRCRDDVVRNLVVGPVGAQVLLHPKVQEVLPAPHLAVRAEQIHEVVGPLLDILFAVEHPIDQLVSFVWVFIRQEDAHFRGSRDAPRQVERHPPQKLDVRRRPRMRHAIALHLAEDVIVNEVSPLDEARLRARFGPEQPIRQLRRFVRLRKVEQGTMRLGKLLRAEDLGTSLPRLALLLRRQHRSCQQHTTKYIPDLLHERLLR